MYRSILVFQTLRLRVKKRSCNSSYKGLTFLGELDICFHHTIPSPNLNYCADFFGSARASIKNRQWEFGF